MSRMSWRAVPGPERLVLLSAPGRDAVLATVAVLLTAGVFAAVGDHGMLTSIQRLDDEWLRLMVSGRTAPLTAIAKVFNILGLVYVTLPARIAVAGLLALRRRWWQLAVFTARIATRCSRSSASAGAASSTNASNAAPLMSLGERAAESWTRQAPR